MAQKDWTEVLQIISQENQDYLSDFLASDEIFLPNSSQTNLFNEANGNLSASELGKSRPGSWIPLYHPKELPLFFHDNNITPVRSGQAEFFFYRGSVFFDLQKLDYKEIDKEAYEPVASFVPLTLKVDFQRNENAYLNKAVALGIINHFVDGDDTRYQSHQRGLSVQDRPYL